MVNSCSIDDGPAIAEVFVSAFWTDPTWKVIWPGKTLEYVTSQQARRMPHTLLQKRANRRHQKVVDPDTNTVVGYARWTFPEADNLDVKSFWALAKVPSVTSNQTLAAEAENLAADYEYDKSLDRLDQPLDEMMSRLTSQKKYIGK